MINCTNCHAEIGDDVNFCPYCGTKVVRLTEVVCPNCGMRYTDTNVKYCSECGTRIQMSGNTESNENGSVNVETDPIDALVNELNTVLARLGKNESHFTKDEVLSFCDFADEGRYETFYVPKKHKGRYRMVSSPNPRLKLILRCLNVHLQDKYEPAKSVTGFVKGSSIVDNGKIHVGQRYVYTIDLSDFFQTVKLELIEKCLEGEPFRLSSEVARTIASLSCVRNEKNDTVCLSQGSPLSPLLSNIACAELDKKLNGISSFYCVRYSRYADDITFSSATNVFSKGSNLSQSVRSIVESYGFRINKDKVHVYGPQARHYITGVVANERINVPREYIRGIRNLLFIWEEYGIKDAYMKFDESYQKRHRRRPTPFIGNSLRGRIEYVGTVRGKDDAVYLRFKQKLESLLAVPFKSFCGEVEESCHGVEFHLSAPVFRQGKKYYTATRKYDRSLILISPKFNDFIESGAEQHPERTIAANCSLYRIYDRDGVKVLIAKKMLPL